MVVRQLRALDLFCCAGGAAKGLQKAGFHVTGIDIKKRIRYAGDKFIQADAIKPPVSLSKFDFIWASPPCQAHTELKWMHNAKKHEDLIPQTRELLERSGVLYAMENVMYAPLRKDLTLCGTMFGLGTKDAELHRHRKFEMNWQVPLFSVPHCRHGKKKRVIGVYGGHGRDRRRTINTQDFSTKEQKEAMGIDWMTGAELSEAIPPAYSEFIGKAASEIILRGDRP